MYYKLIDSWNSCFNQLKAISVSEYNNFIKTLSTLFYFLTPYTEFRWLNKLRINFLLYKHIFFRHPRFVIIGISHINIAKKHRKCKFCRKLCSVGTKGSLMKGLKVRSRQCDQTPFTMRPPVPPVAPHPPVSDSADCVHSDLVSSSNYPSKSTETLTK